MMIMMDKVIYDAAAYVLRDEGQGFWEVFWNEKLKPNVAIYQWNKFLDVIVDTDKSYNVQGPVHFKYAGSGENKYYDNDDIM